MNKTQSPRINSTNQNTPAKKNPRGPLSPNRKTVGVKRDSPYGEPSIKSRTVPSKKQSQASPDNDQQKRLQESKIEKRKQEAQRKKQEAIDQYNDLLELRDQKLAERDELLQKKKELEEQKQQLQDQWKE